MSRSAEEYFKDHLYYEDKRNSFHPDQVDKLTDIETVKTYYRLTHDMLDFHRKNMAANYLSLIGDRKSKKNEGKNNV
jgi:hypothetical protein